MLRKNEGKWQRTGNIPSDNLNCWNLETEEGYKFYPFNSEIDRELEKLTEKLGDDKERIEQLTKNAEKAKSILDSESNSFRDYPAVALHDDNLAFDALIKSSASLSWHEQELILAAMDVEDFITKRLADDVLAGKIIPCALGQMPEDYIYLADKCHRDG